MFSMLLDLEDFTAGLALRDIWEKLTKVTRLQLYIYIYIISRSPLESSLNPEILRNLRSVTKIRNKATPLHDATSRVHTCCLGLLLYYLFIILLLLRFDFFRKPFFHEAG